LQEECLLLLEEMRWVLATFSWQSEKWMKIAQQFEAIELSLSQTVPALAQIDTVTQAIKKEDKIAYAYRQAVIHNRMLNHYKLQ
jgi:hypothetical protein